MKPKTMVQNLCEHTYVRWVEKVATCAVCDLEFDYEYDPQWVGTFPREKLKFFEPTNATNSTFTVLRYYTDEL